MLREFRVKDESFDSFNVDGSVITAKFLPHVINGQIEKIVFTNVTSPGSIWFTESGTNIIIFNKNNVTSGVGFEVYPSAFMVDAANTTGSPYSVTKLVTNNVLYVAGSGFTSGIAKTFGPISIVYR